MNRPPVMRKKGLVVYWHYFSRPRASCRRGEHPNTPESRAEVWSAKRNDVCTCNDSLTSNHDTGFIAYVPSFQGTNPRRQLVESSINQMR